ncbi:MAG: S1 RNA-binding domain-containing protein, partial [Patescibacteria group bacterium]
MENIMQNLASKMPKAFDMPKTGEVIEGRVMKKSTRNLYIDLGIWGIGIVYGIEFMNAQDIIKGLKIGDPVFAKIVEVQNDDGFRELSLAEAGKQRSWDLIRELKKTNHPITTKILSVNRGGLMVEISGIAGFLPVSQLASEHYPRVEGGDKNRILEELQKFIGADFNVRVLDFDVKESKLIVSEKAAEEEHLKKTIKHYKVGDIVTGSVSGIVDWGVFIKWGAEDEILEGLIHISELDWQLVENPADLVKVGDELLVQIIDIVGDRISLSLKRLKTDPWKTASSLLEKGMIIEGTVKKFNTFGAFIEIVCHPSRLVSDESERAGDEQRIDFLQGLCHISEFGSEEKMKQILEVGKKYQFKILAFVPEE